MPDSFSDQILEMLEAESDDVSQTEDNDGATESDPLLKEVLKKLGIDPESKE